MGISQVLKRIKKEYLAVAIFAALVILFYGNTLFNGFVQDDVPIIERNAYIHSLKYLPKVVTGCLWEYANKGCKGTSFYYRPIQVLFFTITYQISSRPWFFHLVHLLYLFAAVFLVFKFVEVMTNNFLLSFVTSLVFFIHPVNNEVINWICTGTEIIFVSFVLLTAIFHLKYRHNGSKRNLFFVYLFYFFALLSKETAVVTPFVIFSLDLFILKMKLKKLLSWSELKRYLLFVIPFFIYFVMRTTVLGGASYLGDFSLSERIYAFVVLFAKYIGKLFYPYPLQNIYNFKISDSLSSPLFLLSFLGVLTFFGLLVFLIKKRQNLLAFCFVWFLTFLLPPIIFLQAAGAGIGFFFERYAFASSIGFSLFIAYLFCAVLKIQRVLAKKDLKSKALLILLSIALASSWYLIHQRNRDWKNNETIFRATLNQVPDAHNFRYQLGVFYYERGELEKAKAEFDEIIRRDAGWRDITMVYKSLGDYYRAKNDLDNALIAYQKSVETAAPSPRDYVSFNDLGSVYIEKGNYLKGLVYFCQSLYLYPSETGQFNFEQALALIESTYLKEGTLYQKILEELEKSFQERIIYLDKNCLKNTCTFGFSFRSEIPEIILPFLITGGISPDNKDIKIKDSSFDPQQGIITLVVGEEFSDKDINFIFPTCQGIYYEVTSN